MTNVPTVKDYAVIMGNILLKANSSSAMGVIELIKKAAAEKRPLYCETINPEDFKSFNDTMTVVIPGPGMVFEVQPWEKFVKNQKQARGRKALDPRQQPQRGRPMRMMPPRGNSGR
jgi:hypothetical protein